jgi:tripartite-type tricarboxylate transporter receptor subunit TctC
MGPIRKLWAAVASVAAVAVATAAPADEWPTHQILVISPFAAGTTNDIVAHTVLDPVGSQIGQPFTIENHPGGGGNVGVISVVKAAPDGHTLLLATSAMTAAAIQRKSLPYDAVHDLAPVAMFGGEPSMLMAAPGKGYTNVADLVAAAKANPGKVKFGSVGIGSASFIAGQRFSQLAGIEAVHVVFAGAAAALHDLSGGRIDFYFVPVTPALPLIVQGKAVPLAVSTPNRLQSLPGLPTLIESGYPLPVYLTWCGLAAPANTSSAIVSKLNAVIGKVLELPAVRTKLLRVGYLPEPMTVEQFEHFIVEDWAAMIRFGQAAPIEAPD